MDIAKDWLASAVDLAKRAGRYWTFSLVGGIGGVAAAVIGTVQQSGGSHDAIDAVIRWLDLVWPVLFFGGIPVAVMAAYHELWEANANLLKNEHARAVVGSVAVRPGIAGGGRVKGLGTVLLPLVQMTNHGEGTIEYRVLGLDVSFDNDQSSAAGHLEGSIASGDRVLIPAGTIGPYAPGTSGRGQFFFAIAFGKPLSRSTVIERWAFEVEATVLKNGDFDEGVKGTTGNHHLVDAMRPEFVDRPIADLVEMEPGEVALAWRDRLPVNSDRRVS